MGMSGQHVLVTGASSGIGKATAIALARRGARLVLSGRDPERLAETAALCLESCETCETIHANLSDAEGRAELCVGVQSVIGDLDILVHCAGVIKYGTVSETPPNAFESLLQVNTIAPLELTQHLLPGLRRRRGQIVFLNRRAPERGAEHRGPQGAAAQS